MPDLESTANSLRPLGYPPSTSTWPPIPPHHPTSPPTASYFSVNSITISVARLKTVTWYLTHIFSYIPHAPSPYIFVYIWTISVAYDWPLFIHLYYLHSTVPKVLRRMSPKSEKDHSFAHSKPFHGLPSLILTAALRVLQVPHYVSGFTAPTLPLCSLCSRLTNPLSTPWTFQAQRIPESLPLPGTLL